MMTPRYCGHRMVNVGNFYSLGEHKIDTNYRNKRRSEKNINLLKMCLFCLKIVETQNRDYTKA